MKTLTIGKILHEYQDFLTDYEIEELRKVQRTPSDFATQVGDLERVLFNEIFDFMYDSRMEAKDRKKGINPMGQEYIDRINKKRKAFGVSPLSEAGYNQGDSSKVFCEEVVRHTKNYKEILELKRNKTKQVVFVDMDNVLVDFKSGIDKISKEDYDKYGPDNLDEVPHIFSLMEPYEGAIEGFKWLSKNFDTYILSTAPWDNPSAWIDKVLWVKKYLPEVAYKRLILSHHKNLANGAYLIDDRTKNGADKFSGKHIHFGPKGHKDFGDWKAVVSYLKNLV